MTNDKFNLLTDPWIPLKRQSGSIEMVEPWRVTDGHDSNPFVSLAYPRPDFNGAMLEFFIGLFSTAGLVDDESDWIVLWENPPDSEVLRRNLEPLKSAFWLDATSHRFMQDEDPLSSLEPKPIHSLLIDAPGKQTLKHNADHFVKREAVTRLSRAAVAAALYTLNTYAPSGGAGHRTSLRGGGPMTTLAILRDKKDQTTIWSRIWPNVETKEQVVSRGENEHDTYEFDTKDLSKIFPWMGSTKVSTKNRSTLPGDIHPLHVYWGMPRRIRLVIPPRTEISFCDIFGDSHEDWFVTHYRTQNYGFNYQLSTHPLTPYYEKSSKGPSIPLPQHPQPGGFSYRNWPGIVFDNPQESKFAAKAIQRVLNHRNGGTEFQVTAYGFDMDNMKVRAWMQSEWPIYIGNSEVTTELSEFVKLIVSSAEKISQILINAIRNALYDSARAPTGSFGFAEEQFFRGTEKYFLEAFRNAVDTLLESSSEETGKKTESIRANWVQQSGQIALDVFDEHVPLDQVVYSRIGTHVRQRFLLYLAVNGLGKAGKALFSLLDIPTPNSLKRK